MQLLRHFPVWPFGRPIVVYLLAGNREMLRFVLRRKHVYPLGFSFVVVDPPSEQVCVKRCERERIWAVESDYE